MKTFYDDIAPKFRRRKTYCDEKFREMEKIVAAGEFDEFQRRVNDFVNNVSSFSGVIGLLYLSRLSLAELRFLFAKKILGQLNSCQQISLVSLKLFWVAQLEFYNFERLKRVFIGQGRTDRPPFLVTVADLGNRLSLLAIYGNEKLYKQFLLFSLDLFDRGAPLDQTVPLAQLFIFRLSERFLSLPPRGWDDGKTWSVDPCEKDPLFFELWKHWDTEDLSLIQSLLIQLANRHTFQASRNNKDGGRDFEGHAEQYPIDLHFIMRLREWRGLPNPEIKHRLTEPPFDKLPEPVENIVLPDELHQVMKKIREVIPDFDATINAAKTRDWQMLL